MSASEEGEIPLLLCSSSESAEESRYLELLFHSSDWCLTGEWGATTTDMPRVQMEGIDWIWWTNAMYGSFFCLQLYAVHFSLSTVCCLYHFRMMVSKWYFNDVIPNPHDFLSLVEHKRSSFAECLGCSFIQQKWIGMGSDKAQKSTKEAYSSINDYWSCGTCGKQ